MPESSRRDDEEHVLKRDAGSGCGVPEGPGTYRVVSPGTGVVILELRGEHDLAGRDQLAELLAGMLVTNSLVVVDLSAAEFIDSSVLVNLVKADRKARGQGKLFRLQVGSASIVRKALEISHVLDDLEWAETRKGALRPRIRLGPPVRPRAHPPVRGGSRRH